MYGDETSLYTTELDVLIERWSEIHRIRKDTTLYLMETRPWDFFMVVFYSIDAIQHRFWEFHDATHPLHKPWLAERYGRIIGEFYQKVDRALGEILGRLDEDTTVLIVSDHGAGPEHKAFLLNRWLMNEGLLKIQKRFWPLVGLRFPHIVYKVLRRLGFRGVSWTIPRSLYAELKDRVDPRDGLSVSHLIDWSATRAFAGNHTEQGIYINLKGREPRGIVSPGKEYEELREHISARLSAVIDPDTGEHVVERVYKREELYQGPYVGHAADLFLRLGGGRYLAQRELHHRQLFRLADKTSGTHRMNGVFVLKGAGVKRGATVEGLRIIDVAPTVLYAMGLPIPDDMDGRMAVEVFEDGVIRKQPVLYVRAAEAPTHGASAVYGHEEEERIKESLRSLGYLR
jgi:predicted AlkP superfamily phosphohydrolase/phosphomutase